MRTSPPFSAIIRRRSRPSPRCIVAKDSPLRSLPPLENAAFEPDLLPRARACAYRSQNYRVSPGGISPSAISARRMIAIFLDRASQRWTVLLAGMEGSSQIRRSGSPREMRVQILFQILRVSIVGRPGRRFLAGMVLELMASVRRRGKARSGTLHSRARAIPRPSLVPRARERAFVSNC